MPHPVRDEPDAGIFRPSGTLVFTLLSVSIDMPSLRDEENRHVDIRRMNGALCPAGKGIIGAFQCVMPLKVEITPSSVIMMPVNAMVTPFKVAIMPVDAILIPLKVAIMPVNARIKPLDDGIAPP
jgi:hypothetical protein